MAIIAAVRQKLHLSTCSNLRELFFFFFKKKKKKKKKKKNFHGSTRTFSGTPPVNFNGQVAIKATVSDGLLSASDTFTLTIAPVNDPLADFALTTGADTVTGTAINDTVYATAATLNAGESLTGGAERMFLRWSAAVPSASTSSRASPGLSASASITPQTILRTSRSAINRLRLTRPGVCLFK